MSFPSNGRLAEVLLVEDSLADIHLFNARMKADRLHFNLHCVRNGEEALDFLHRCKANDDAKRPDVIFLDLNLPRMSGAELLEEIQKDGEFYGIVKVMLSGTESRDDIQRMQSLGITHTFMKPLDSDKLRELVDMVDTLSLEPFEEKLCLVHNIAA